MGAEAWGCWTRYQPDLDKALADAQQEVFERGDYQRPWADVSWLEELGLFECDEGTQEMLLDEYGLQTLRPIMRGAGAGSVRQRIEELNARPVLRSLRDVQVLRCLSDSGTASILDMDGITDHLKSGAVAPLPSEELTRLYGTDKPTRAQVEADSDIYDLLHRGQGVCVVAYDGDAPSAIFFAGMSYD